MGVAPRIQNFTVYGRRIECDDGESASVWGILSWVNSICVLQHVRQFYYG